MAFDELKKHTDDIQDHAKGYMESSLAYYKLWSFKVAMKSISTVFKFTLILLCFSMVLLFCSVAGALAIGKVLDNYAFGFLIVGGVYLVLMVLFFFIKDKLVEGPVLEKFSEIFFND